MEDKRIQQIISSHIEEIIVITDKNGFIIWANEWFTKLTEYSLEEVQGKKPGSFLQGE